MAALRTRNHSAVCALVLELVVLQKLIEDRKPLEKGIA